MPPAHLDAGELLQKKAVGGRVGRAGHAGEKIRVGEVVCVAHIWVTRGGEDCERCAGRLCQGGPGVGPDFT